MSVYRFLRVLANSVVGYLDELDPVLGDNLYVFGKRL